MAASPAPCRAAQSQACPISWSSVWKGRSGSIDATTLGNGCNGHIANAPDFQLTYNAGSFPLYFSVLSDADTTLVINGPDGSWYCNDDTNGLNPVVVFGDGGGTATSGTYDVWVGTFGDSNANATLYISELSAAGGGGDGPIISGPITLGPDPSLPGWR